mmetsp:Transcript_131286/g.365925  ORF Transcript_131286/g.365925 Transcript_131286/m.365925 type:complete len:202 (+) Transcript_131286:539-1144(+)
MSWSRSTRISPTRGVSRRWIRSTMTQWSLERLSRMALATSKPMLCTRGSLRSRMVFSTAFLCTSVNQTSSRTFNASGARSLSLLLMFRKPATAMAWTTSLSERVRTFWPTLMTFSAATSCSSGLSSRPRAEMTGGSASTGAAVDQACVLTVAGGSVRTVPAPGGARSQGTQEAGGPSRSQGTREAGGPSQGIRAAGPSLGS